jgi:hypothetical protein
MSGPASQTISPAGSASATQPPLDILANETLHQLGSMGFHEAADRFLDHLVPAFEPALFDERVDLTIQSLGDSRFDGSHSNVPRELRQTDGP